MLKDERIHVIKDKKKGKCPREGKTTVKIIKESRDKFSKILAYCLRNNYRD